CPPTVGRAPHPPIAAVRRAGGHGRLVELPVGLIDRDIGALYRSIDHRRRIVNGYSGFFPPHCLVLLVALRYDDLDALRELARGESLTIMIDRTFQFDRWASALAARHADLVAVERDAYVYLLAGPPADHCLA